MRLGFKTAIQAQSLKKDYMNTHSLQFRLCNYIYNKEAVRRFFVNIDKIEYVFSKEIALLVYQNSYYNMENFIYLKHVYKEKES